MQTPSSSSVCRYLLSVAAAGIFAIANAPAMAQHVGNIDDGLAAEYSSVGPFTVESSDAVWRDAARGRDLPVRILSPRAAISSYGEAARYPVIIFSHGLGGSREGGALWGQHWASHGFIVVHLQHPGSDEAIWKNTNRAEALGNMKRAMNLDNSRLRVADISFAIDEMARLQVAQIAPFVNADLMRIGMSGHSFGAQTTLAVVGQQWPGMAGSGDSRICAAIAFSPNARQKTGLDKQFGAITLPMLSITGTRDGGVLDASTHYEDRLLPYEKMPPGNKYLVSFLDGDHMVFGGHMLGGRRPETVRDRKIQAGVKAVTLAFWNATLKQDKGATIWLRQDFRSTLVDGDIFSYK